MTKQTDLKRFEYSGSQGIRELEIEGNPFFVARDVCEILEHTNVTMALEKLDEDDKLLSKLLISGQLRETWVINESGLYHLILTSTKPEAKNFRRWVTKVVLPQIRKDGRYTSEQERYKADRIKQLRTELKQLKFDFSQMRHSITQKEAELDRLIDTEPNQIEIFTELKSGE